jgi:predicted molibdopterin-dependent oxidoreductase YjgC
VASETGVDPAWLSSFVGTIRTAERPAVIVGRLPRDQYGPARGMLSRLLETLQSGRRMPVAGGILVGGANSRGLRMVGCSSAALPGAEPLPKPWREALVAGDLEALLIVGGDPLAGSSPEVMDAARALSSLVYVGTNHNTTSALATLRMAAASFAEEPLTYVNFEGRLQESVPTNEPIGRTWTTYRILGRLCAAVGAWQGELTADSVRRAIAESQPGLQPWAGPIGEQGEML